MKNEFKKILLVLEKMNKNKTTISSVDLKKEYENIHDLEDLDKDVLKSVDQLKEINDSSIDEIMEQLCSLDTQLNTYIWHTESMRDIIQKFIYYERFKI